MGTIYWIFQQIGYDHPLHPPLAHMPIGLIVGAFTFLIVALILKRDCFLDTAHCCITLAMIFLLPTIFFGFTDWQQYYGGVWSFSIKMKIAITGLLLIFLVVAIAMEIKKKGGLMGKSFVYFLCLACVAGIGYFGGSLVYPEKSIASPDQIREGEKLYAAHCASCHPGGGNVINPSLPVVGSAHLNDLNTFTEFNRNPVKADGSKGVMQAFPKEKISNEEMKRIHEYVTTSLTAKPSR